MRKIINIQTRDQLVRFQQDHGLRESWHEPDEQDVDAYPAIGTNFDNACCDPLAFEVSYARSQDEGGIHATVFSVLTAGHRNMPRGMTTAEHGVFLFVEGEPAAFVNLALLLAMACGYEGFGGDDELVEVPW